MECKKSHHCHGGTLSYYTHDSVQTGTAMNFSLFVPPQAEKGTVPYVVFLSGLTCTEDNFTTKAQAYMRAAELGLAVLAPDTSPRGKDVPDDESYDLGQGAGFYLDATQAPWNTHFRMESYLIQELLPLVEKDMPLAARKSIFGHSMGGHGALTLYLRHPGLFQSCSAFSPIVAPSRVPWGRKAFAAYLGADEAMWRGHDACALVSQAPTKTPILIDQGAADPYLEEQLQPHLFDEACRVAGQPLTLRLQDGYDHSYFFIQSFMADHLDWHKTYLLP